MKQLLFRRLPEHVAERRNAYVRFVRREQGVYRAAKDSVAFARKYFKSFGIEKGDPAARITDQPLHLQQARRRADVAAGNTQYLRHRLMCNIESAIACPIARQEQPTGQPLIYRVEMVTDRRLRNLFTQNVGMVDQG